MKNKTQLTFPGLIIISLFLNNTLNADAVFDPMTQPITMLAPYTLKATNLQDGDTKAYRPWFESGNWQGDVIEYNVTKNGVLSTDVININTHPPAANGSNWSARATMAANEIDSKDYWKNTRKIITSISGTDQIAFQWKKITKTQQSEIYPDNKVGEKVVNFIRGDRKEDGGIFRTRTSLLGDITSSTLVYVGAPSTGYSTLPGYVDYANSSRTGRIYAGANDGMIHAFDENDGSEVFAYIPSMLISRLGELSDMNYDHKGYITSELVASDAQIGSTWKTVLTGGLGAGAKGLFALDVTSPDLSKETSSDVVDKKILWEKHGEDDNDLGYIYGKSSVVMLSDNKWYVVNGNGYGSSNGDAKLYLIEVGTGNVKTLDTVSDSKNGLSAPTLVDTNYDSIADFAYAGDLKGNLWKFDLSNLSQPGTLLFKAGRKNPITVEPEIAQHPLGGYLVYFGTGSLLSADDKKNTDKQSIFAIWDKDTLVKDSCGNSSGDLLCQEISGAISAQDSSVKTVTKYDVDWKNHMGWKVDLTDSGERLLGHPQLRDGRLQFVTHNPTGDINSSWLVELDYLTGGSSGKILFDLNNTGSLDEGDKVMGRAPDALYLGTGYFSQPAIARIEKGFDTLFINGLYVDNTLVEESKPETILCTGDCLEGVVGGHFDLDVDIELGGSTDEHTHEYDDKFDVTYGDYLNVLNGAPSVNSPEVGINAGSQKLLAFIANADLSIGGNITIGAKTWNVVEYQKMIQKQLANWDGASVLMDDNNDPLAFTLDEINQIIKVGSTDIQGTLRLSFDNSAILTGGLIPTQTGCVKSEPNITKGHWRNGALTMHVVDYESVRQNIVNNTAVLDRVYSLQSVTDLPESINLTSKNKGTILLKEDTDFDGIVDTEYAGIIANPANASGFLYESTIFWHYKGACYGEIDWEEDTKNAVILESQLAAFLAQEAALIDEIKNYSCQDVDTNTGACKDNAYKELVIRIQDAAVLFFGEVASSTYDIGEAIASLVKGNVVYVDSGPIDLSVPMKDLSLFISETPGPSFRYGRQSWLDF